MKHSHPVDFVECLLAEAESVAEGQISVYRCHPQSLFDDRTVYRVPIGNLRTKYNELTEQLEQGQDIAFDSVVTMNDGSQRHLGLLDFLTSEPEPVQKASGLLVTEYGASRAALVHSGKSYHLYMGVFLSHASWVQFMGRVLLLNRRDEPATVDQRWVGHRLMGGYGSLRWSAKTSPCLPKVIREW